MELSAYERYRHEKLLVQPGKAELTSENISNQLKKWEGSGMKGVMFFVPEWNEEATDKFAELGTGPIEPLGPLRLHDVL